MVTSDPSWRCTQGCNAHHAVMLDLECFGMKVHDAPCSCAGLPAAKFVYLDQLFRATILTDAEGRHVLILILSEKMLIDPCISSSPRVR